MLKKLISVLLCVSFLTACAVPAFAAEAEPQPPAQTDSTLTLEGMWEAYEARDMEQLQVYFDALGVNAEEEQPTIAPRWASGGGNGKNEKTACHQGLTAYGFLIYVSAMQTLFGKQLSAMGFTFADLQTLVEQSAKPDHILSSLLTAFRGHFYDPDTGTNYLDGTSLTAKSNVIDYYQRAVSAFTGGNRADAMKHLGYVLHYLEDLNEPHHAANLPAKQEGSRHEEFEELADMDLLNEFMELEAYEIDPTLSFYTGYLTRSVGDSAHETAKAAKVWIGCAQSTNESVMRIGALFTFGNAMSSVSGLLYRFAKDTRMI